MTMRIPLLSLLAVAALSHLPCPARPRKEWIASSAIVFQLTTFYADHQTHRRAHGFNVSIAELDDANLWNRATLGFVAISSSSSYLAGQMQELDDALSRLTNTLGAEILDSYVEILD